MLHGGARALPRWLLASMPLLFLGAVCVAPMLRLLAEGGAGYRTDAFAAIWQDSYLRGRLAWSFLQAAASSLMVLVLGLPVAWVLARFEFAGRSTLLRLLMLPFVMPALVASLGVLALWGPQGLAMQWLGVDLSDTPWLLVYGNVFFNLCLAVRAGVDGLGQVSASQLAAARTLGASPWRAFWRVEWPTVRPWLSSALCLVFLYCFSGFGIALILGGQRYATLEVEIYTLVAHELKLADAGMLASITMGITAVAALLYTFRESRLSAPTRADAVPLRSPRTARERCAVAAALAVLGVCCASPLLAIALRVVQAGPAVWAVALQEDTLAALWNTLRFSFMAVCLATVLGLAHALAAQRSTLMRSAALLPFVVSPVTVAFGLLLLYPQWSATLPMLVTAYALLAYPLVTKSITSALDSLPEHLQHAARTLGASLWRCFWRVTLPLIMPALRRGMAFAAASALGEFAVSLFLSRPEWTTLTTLIYQRLGRPGADSLNEALVLACLLVLLALGAFLALEYRPSANTANTMASETAHA
jgi:thiamine transport system permease protein